MSRHHPLQCGILGNADIYRRRFLPALQAATHARFGMLGTRGREQAAPETTPVARFLSGSYDQVLASPDISLVYIALPNHLHEEWVVRALRAGKHVICEKPLGLDFASVQRMLAVAQAEQRLLYENIMYLHHPQHRIIRELVQSGKIGKIRQFQANFCFTQSRSNDFRLDLHQGGGTFHDQARYPLTAALYHLTGKLNEFSGTTRYRDGLDFAVSGSSLSSNDELFTFTIAFDQPYQAYYEIIGEHGTIRLDRAYTTPADMANNIKITCGMREESIKVAPVDHFQLMIEYVCRLITTRNDFSLEHQLTKERTITAEAMRRGCLRVQP